MKDPNDTSTSSARHFPDVKFDSTGDYKIFPYFMSHTANEGSPRQYKVEDVTLVSQGSFHHIGHVVGIVERWKGPVSVSLFCLETDLDLTRSVIESLRECYPVVMRNVSFHIVHPIIANTEEGTRRNGTLSQQDNSSLMNRSYSCATLHSNLLTMNRQSSQKFANYAQDGVPYPVNLMRNVARMETTSTYVLVIDIDMLPSANLRTEFVRLVARSRSSSGLEESDFRKTLFILPTFAVREVVSLPSDKADLLKLWRQGNARQFHVTFWPQGHHQTDYHRWKNTRVGLMCRYWWAHQYEMGTRFRFRFWKWQWKRIVKVMRVP